jgi:hypothetical protein
LEGKDLEIFSSPEPPTAKSGPRRKDRGGRSKSRDSHDNDNLPTKSGRKKKNRDTTKRRSLSRDKRLEPPKDDTPLPHSNIGQKSDVTLPHCDATFGNDNASDNDARPPARKSGQKKLLEETSLQPEEDSANDIEDSRSKLAPYCNGEEKAIVQNLACAVLTAQIMDCHNSESLEYLVKNLEDTLHLAKQTQLMRDMDEKQLIGKGEMNKLIIPPVSTTSSGTSLLLHCDVPSREEPQAMHESKLFKAKKLRSLFRNLRPRGRALDSGATTDDVLHQNNSRRSLDAGPRRRGGSVTSSGRVRLRRNNSTASLPSMADT